MLHSPLAPAIDAGQAIEASPVPTTIEQRFARRKRSAANGLILSPALSVPLSCVLRDVSSTGARIELVASLENLIGGRAKLPNSFTLNMRLDRMEVDCAIVWRRGAFVGVRFTSTPRFRRQVGRIGRGLL